MAEHASFNWPQGPLHCKTARMERTPAELGVAIALYNSQGVIAECLDSLMQAGDASLRIVLVDNCSTDATVQTVRQWAARHAGRISYAEAAVGEIDRAESWLTMLLAPANGGFAYGCNRALELLLADPVIDLFWLLNPDTRTAPHTPAAYLRAGADGAFALMGGRTLYDRPGDVIQTDGGRLSRWTGRCHPVNLGRAHASAKLPDASSLDFISGANCVVSRRFIETAGLMAEDYFLFYEEVDWAMRRGTLPLRVASDALVRHHGGSAIGSARDNRRASPLANYYTYRNRMRFVARHFPFGLPGALMSGLAKSAQLALLGDAAGAWAVMAGTMQLRQPASAGPPAFKTGDAGQ